MIGWRDSIAKLLAGCRYCSPRIMAAALLALGVLLLGTAALLTQPENLPDMHVYEPGAERKAAFFEFMRPIVEAQNRKILAEREALLEIADHLESGGEASFLHQLRLESLAQNYDVEFNEDDVHGVVKTLKRRIDMVPTALVLVQAAKESAWGTSRFAREGNNLFGEWCYRAGCGIVPGRRATGAKHEVRLFDSVGDAVAAYLRNINTSYAYRQLRVIRAEARRANREPTAASLANGLILYSQRREAYVNEVKTMIRQYHRFQSRHAG